jgi:hypothetical protein
VSFRINVFHDKSRGRTSAGRIIGYFAACAMLVAILVLADRRPVVLSVETATGTENGTTLVRGKVEFRKMGCICLGSRKVALARRIGSFETVVFKSPSQVRRSDYEAEAIAAARKSAGPLEIAWHLVVLFGVASFVFVYASWVLVLFVFDL